MSGIRRALLLTTSAQYFGMAVQFALMAAVSRLLTPGEVGVSVVGTWIIAVAFSLREFATSDFLVQRKEVTREDVRTSFTLLLGLTALIAAAIFALASSIAGYYRQDGLSRFLCVIAAAAFLEVIQFPIIALLRREMAFGTLALISMASVTISAIVTLTLAALGFSYMSIAWAWLGGAATTTVIALYLRPHLWIFRPSLSSWRACLTFGSYNGATILLQKVYEALPQLVLGRILPLSAVGLYNRANLVCGIAERIILSQVFSVAMPAFAAMARQGHSVKQPYLRAISYITVIHWPAAVVLALLAHPIVMLVLGRQWISIVPLVQIMSVAYLFFTPVTLTGQVLVALGAIRHNFISSLIARPITVLVLCIASFFGLTALAASQFLVVPFQLYMVLHFIRLHVPFRWDELAAAVWKSALVTACSAAGPVAVMAVAGFRSNLSIGGAVVGGLLAVICWAGGVWVTRHPMLIEIQRVFGAMERSSLGQQMIGAGSRFYR